MIRLPEKPRILIVKPSSFGDIIHSLPLLKRLKDSLKGCTIHWVVAKGLEEILEGHPMIDRLWIINKDEWKNIKKLGVMVEELKKLFRNLKAERYDLVIDLQGLLRSGIISKATGSGLRIGFADAREGARYFYTHTVKTEKDIHAVDRYLRIADFLGLEGDEVHFPLPPIGAYDLKDLADPFREDYAIISPGARWLTKRWPPERFGKVASLLPLRTIVIGSASEVSIADEVVKASEGRAISIAGKTGLKELLSIIKGARFMLSNDSGPMHLAVALGVPVFAIFGPTDPVKVGPYGKGHTIISLYVPCSPCRKRRCKEMRCMFDLKAETVYEIIREKVL